MKWPISRERDFQKAQLMSDGATGFLVLMGLSVVVAVGSHWTIRRYLLASIVAAMLASVAFQVVIYLKEGYLDSFFLIALGFGALVALGIAAIVGIPFMLVRRSRKKRAGAITG
jgi:hypothetical protein